MKLAIQDSALARIILSDVLTLPEEIDGRISFGADTHQLLRYAATRAYLQMPHALRAFLAQRGARFVLGSYYDAAAGNGPQPMLSINRRDNLRLHRNQSPGLFDNKANIAYAFQYTLRRDIVPVIGQRPTQAAVTAGIWRMNGPRAVARIARHEVWHAIDYNAGLPSRWSSFRRAYMADIAALGGPEALRRAGWGYFIQDDTVNRGPSEAFAETGAALNGGGVRGKMILQKFVRTAQFVQQFQQELMTAHAPVTAPAESAPRTTHANERHIVPDLADYFLYRKAG